MRATTRSTCDAHGCSTTGSQTCPRSPLGRSPLGGAGRERDLGSGAPADPRRRQFVVIPAVAVLAHTTGAVRDVDLHQVADVGLAQELVTTQRVLDARGGKLLASGHAGEVGRSIVFLADLAQAARQPGGGAERRHPVTLDQSGDGRVIDPRLEGQLALAHLLLLQLAAEPAVEGVWRLERHAACPCAAAHLVASIAGWCVRATAESQRGALPSMGERYRPGAACGARARTQPARRAQGAPPASGSTCSAAGEAAPRPCARRTLFE